jgi:hypothetical protein
VAGWGPVRPGAVQRPAQVARYEGEQVTQAQLDVVTTIDRGVRGSARTDDVKMMLSDEGTRLLLHDDQAYAVARDDRIVTLGAHNEASATLVLRAMLADAPEGETVEINWLTAAQQWAITVLIQAGVELQPYGPVMVRGMPGPPSPYIPSGGYG